MSPVTRRLILAGAGAYTFNAVLDFPTLRGHSLDGVTILFEECEGSFNDF